MNILDTIEIMSPTSWLMVARSIPDSYLDGAWYDGNDSLLKSWLSHDYPIP